MVAMDLLQLRGAMKRDPKAYEDELALQIRHFQATLQIFDARPSKPSEELSTITTFLSHVVPCYPRELADFPRQIIGLLEQHHLVMDPVLRKTMAECVMMMRNRNMLPAVGVNQLFFQMFRCKDKKLRAALSSHIVQDIVNLNAGKQNNKANKELQNFMFKMLQDRSGVAAKCSLDVLVRLYRKKIWDDAKTVNVIASACFAPEGKVRATALNFFLGVDDEQSAVGGDSDDDVVDEAETQRAAAAAASAAAAAGKKGVGTPATHTHSKRSRKRLLEARRAANRVKRRANAVGEGGPAVRFAALQLLNDAQGFAERLLATLRKSTDKFEVKMLMMNLISRVIATHELLVLSFYPFLQKYLQPHQNRVTNILAFAAQAVHALVPPDAVEPLVKAVANHFVTDGRQDEVIAIGLNTIRELCARQPLAMDETLLRDLVQYKKHKDKGVVMAARGLLSLFRAVAPDLLDKKDRGRPGAAAASGRRAEYGSVRVSEGVEGLELLDADSDTGSEGDSDDSDEGSSGSGSDGGAVPARRVRFASPPPRGGGEDAAEEGEGAAGGGQEDAVSEKEFAVGDRVEARWKGSHDLHPGVVAAKNEDGSYRVEFDDGDVEEREPAAHMQPETKSDDESGDDESGEEESSEEGSEDASEEEEGEEELDEGGGTGEAMEVVGVATSAVAVATEDVARRRDAESFLTAEEFDKIRRMRRRRELEAEMGGRRRSGSKRPSPAAADGGASAGTSGGGAGGRVDPEDLVGQHKRRRMEKAERLESVLRGREGREGAWKDRHERKRQAGGLRNDQAAKNKPYLMVRGSRRVRAKLKVSVADRNRRTSRAVKRKQFRGKNGGK